MNTTLYELLVDQLVDSQHLPDRIGDMTFDGIDNFLREYGQPDNPMHMALYRYRWMPDQKLHPMSIYPTSDLLSAFYSRVYVVTHGVRIMTMWAVIVSGAVYAGLPFACIVPQTIASILAIYWLKSGVPIKLVGTATWVVLRSMRYRHRLRRR